MSFIDKFKNWKPQKQRELLEQMMMIHCGTEAKEPMFGPLEPVNVAYHDSPETIHRAYWEPTCAANGVTYEDAMTRQAIEVGVNGRGDLVGNTPAQMLAGIREQGCWAFADYNNRTIHLWADGKVPQATIMHMIASEVSGLVPDRFNDEQLQLLRSHQVGQIAELSLAIFSTMMEQRADKLGE